MLQCTYLEPLTDVGWTHDTVIRCGLIGSVRDPIAIVTDSGQRVVPVTINYFAKEGGSRQSTLIPGRYEKRIISYEEGLQVTGDPTLSSYVVFDPHSRIAVIAFPIDALTEWISSQQALTAILESHTAHSELLQKLLPRFPGIEFGVLGSVGAMLGTSGSDLDLCVIGGKYYSYVDTILREQQVQKDLSIIPPDDERQNRYAESYSRRFKITKEKARRLAELRTRYVYKSNNGRLLKFSITGCYGKQDYRMQSLLCSVALSEIEVVGTVIESHNSGCFPREYVVDIKGEQVSILSMLWVMQRMVDVGDNVRVHGTLREANGVKFIGLEQPNHIIISR